MNGVRQKNRLLREGLFAKYVVSLVGLVVFVLAVNGALETWISYRGTKVTLIDGMSEKAESAARRIEQSVAELERQINWVTRASSTRLEDRRADYAQLLNRVPAVSQLSFISGNGREQLRLSRTTILANSNVDFSRDLRFTETSARGVTTYAPAHFQGSQPFMTIAVSHSGQNAGVTLAEIDLSFLSEFLGEAQVGKSGYAYVVDSLGQVLAGSAKGPGGRQGPFETAAGRRPDRAGRRGALVRHRRRRPCGADGRQCGAEARLVRAVRTADQPGAGADPRPAVAERAADRRSGWWSRSSPASCWRGGC